MKEEFEQHEKSIKRRHRFGWKPKYTNEFRTSLTQKGFVAIALKTITQLGWHLVYYDDKTVEASVGPKGFTWGQKLAITFVFGKVEVSSVAPDDGMWDRGINSKKVELFIYAFQQIAKEVDKKELTTLEQEIESETNWEHYEIPTTLPPPTILPTPKVWIPILGSIVAAVILGFAVAFISYHTTYVIVLYEIIVGLVLAAILNVLIKKSHYVNFPVLNGLTIAAVLGIFASHQYFMYLLYIEQGGMPPIGFGMYLSFLLEEGLKLDNHELGWIGLVISWMVQLLLTYWMAYAQLVDYIAQYQLEKVDPEVLNFTLYHFAQNKNEQQVRTELSKMGWTKGEDQDDVFAAIGTMKALQEANRKA